MNVQTIHIQPDEKGNFTVTGNDITMVYLQIQHAPGIDTWETTEGHDGFQAKVDRKPDGFRTKIYNPRKYSHDRGISPTLEEAFRSVHRYIAQRTQSKY